MWVLLNGTDNCALIWLLTFLKNPQVKVLLSEKSDWKAVDALEWSIAGSPQASRGVSMEGTAESNTVLFS